MILDKALSVIVTILNIVVRKHDLDVQLVAKPTPPRNIRAAREGFTKQGNFRDSIEDRYNCM